MKIKLLPIVFCLSLSISAMANKSRPGYQRSSGIVKELLRQEKLVRANKPVDRRMDTRTKDYLRRKVTNMRVSLNQFRKYIYKYKNDTSVRDYLAIMDLFTFAASENRNVRERKVVEQILGSLIRLDAKEGKTLRLDRKMFLEQLKNGQWWRSKN